MNTKTVLTMTLTLALVQVCATLGQQPMKSAPGAYPASTPSTEMKSSSSPATPTPSPPAWGLSDWITYAHPDCCGPIGRHGPIFLEIYSQTGPSFVVSGGFLDDRLETGWKVQAGGRTLFYDPPAIRAWTIDLSLSYIYNNGEANQPLFALEGVPATVRALHRTYGTLSLGREYYLVGSACSPGRRWRAGWDAGILYGTTRLDANVIDPLGEFRRDNTWNYGPVLAVHTDIEIPRGCCTWTVGIRGEWSETFNNALEPPGADHDISDINLLLRVGVRY